MRGCLSRWLLLDDRLLLFVFAVLFALLSTNSACKTKMSTKTSKHAIRLINKCLWKGGAEDLYKSSFKESQRVRSSASSALSTELSCRRQYGRCMSTTTHSINRRKMSSNPMLNGVSMLQWFFDEVRPDQREVRYWMKYFSQATDPKKPFAVIQLSEDVFRREEEDKRAKERGEMKRTILETFALSIYFLQQNKMNILLLVGAADSVSQPSHDSQVVRKNVCRNIRTLIDRLEDSGAEVTPIFDGGHLFNTDENFKVESVNGEQLDWLVRQTSIPVIGCVGESSDGRFGLVQVDEGTESLSAYTKPLKVLLLNGSGGITDHTGQRVTTVFLPKESELKRFSGEPWWNGHVENRFHKVWDTLKVLPKQSSYVVTSARDLLTELLTQRGEGTMFKKVVPVKKYTSLEDEVNCEEIGRQKLIDVLPGLVENAFEKSTSRSYWQALPKDLDAVYLTDDLKSCAIIRNFPMLPDVAYLDKFAVSKEERGNFNIEILWQQLKHDYKSLFWRSRHNNVFNYWYEVRSDGVVKVGYYHIFWFGLSSEDINTIVNQCQNLPNSFDDERVTKSI